MSRYGQRDRTENRIAIREGERSLRRQSTRAAEDLRAMRIRAGVSQAAVAAAVGTSRSVISRLEQGNPAISLRTRFRVAALLGADLRLSAFEGSGALLRDAAQAPMLEKILLWCDRRWRKTLEAPVPGTGRRSVDLRLDGPDRGRNAHWRSRRARPRTPLQAAGTDRDGAADRRCRPIDSRCPRAARYTQASVDRAGPPRDHQGCLSGSVGGLAPGIGRHRASLAR